MREKKKECERMKEIERKGSRMRQTFKSIIERYRQNVKETTIKNQKECESKIKKVSETEKVRENERYLKRLRVTADIMRDNDKGREKRK